LATKPQPTLLNPNLYVGTINQQHVLDSRQEI